jgi:hypothetical protein
MALIQRFGLVLLSATFLMVLGSSIVLCRLLTLPPLPEQRLEEGGRGDRNALPPTLPGDGRLPPVWPEHNEQDVVVPVNAAEGVDQVRAAEAAGALGGLVDPPAAGAAAAAAIEMNVLEGKKKNKRSNVARFMAKYEKK